jgi:hypothetical protein
LPIRFVSGKQPEFNGYWTFTLKNIRAPVGVTIYGDEAVFVVHGPARLVASSNVPGDHCNFNWLLVF